jgi:hypothetical protein
MKFVLNIPGWDPTETNVEVINPPADLDENEDLLVEITESMVRSLPWKPAPGEAWSVFLRNRSVFGVKIGLSTQRGSWLLRVRFPKVSFRLRANGLFVSFRHGTDYRAAVLIWR